MDLPSADWWRGVSCYWSLFLIQYYLFLHLGVAKVIVFVLIVKADVATISSTVSSIAAVIVTVGAQILSTLEQFSANRMVIPEYSNKESIRSPAPH